MMAFFKSICFSVAIAAIIILSLSVVNGSKRKAAQKKPRLVDSCISDNDTTVPPSPKNGDGVQTIMQSVSLQDFDAYLSEYIGNSTNLALLLDYDGTLTPIVSHPDLATLPVETKNVLQTLAKMPNVYIAIISGRGLDDVKNKVGIDGLTYAGNSGLEILFPNGTNYVHPLPNEYREKVTELLKCLQDRVCKHGAWVENKGTILTFHYRKVPEDLRAKLVSEAQRFIEVAGLKVMEAHCALEAKPYVDWNKGKAALHILDKAFGRDWRKKHIRIIFVGDDVVDEDAMKALKGTAVTFRVDASNIVETSAEHRLPDIDSVLNMLKWVARHCDKRELREDSVENLSDG
ncbi:uncharacterized protein LOC126845603 isoform X2 [Adelges cooleyi]|uniref:uncharacterized protein LOC126845603 isoform X2 n=1 Tax=Adelges cooleyi TaxID=133065 RepID=UPI002180119C|nr:uncharacterized protein LOC126845603 isoform X2 [Adelges cooleyi]